MKSGTKRAVVAGVLPLLLAGGCDAQVGETYTGEVLFALEGNVELDADTALVPKLAFIDGSQLVIVEGALSGAFPSKFRLEFTEPPPEHVVRVNPDVAATGINEPAAVGFILMLPPDHPSTIYHMDVEEAGDCSEYGFDLPGTLDASQTCTKTESICPEQGECRVRHFECSLSPCEKIATVGNPEIMNDIWESLQMCFGVPQCYGYEQVCDESECKRDFYACATDELGEYDRVDGLKVSRCELLEESGNTQLLNVNELRTAANGYLVLYTTRAYPDTVLGNVKQGYNLLRMPNPTPEEWVAAHSCLDNPVGEPCADEPMPQVVENHEVTLEVGTPPLF